MNVWEWSVVVALVGVMLLAGGGIVAGRAVRRWFEKIERRLDRHRAEIEEWKR